MSEVKILHLSDIHFKRNENETFREDVQGKMIAAIKKHLEKYPIMEPGFAAVTGDIAFLGKEYDEARVFFKELESVLPKRTKFLVVPGNPQSIQRLDQAISLPNGYRPFGQERRSHYRGFAGTLYPH